MTDIHFLGSKITVDGDCSHEIRWLLPGRKAMTNLYSVLESKDITLPTKFRIVKAMVFFSSHVQMWEFDHKAGRAPKNWYFQAVVLEKTPESPLNSKEIKSVNLKGNQHWIFIGRPDAEAPILWPPDVKSQLIGKDPDAVTKWRQMEKKATEDEIVGWHHQFNGHELGQIPAYVERQGGLACYSPWGCK